MGSSTDGSTAAQSAPETDPDQDRSGGFLSRLFRKAAPLTLNGQTEAQEPVQTSEGHASANLGVGNLLRLRVDDVAIPKTDIVAVPVTISRDELVEVFREHGFSRLPVYNGSMDEAQGVVTLKDFALNCGFDHNEDRFDLAALLRPLLYVPPSMALSVLLQRMQSERLHMALVIDEYGGVDGLVTIEDLLETVVGNIADEHDSEEVDPWVEEAPGVWVIQAQAPLEEVEAAIGLRLRNGEDDQDIDTIGGLAYLRAGHVPAPGEIIVHESGAEFEILESEPRRINKMRLSLPGATSEESGE